MERKITELKIQRKNPNRINVYLDGEFAFGLFRIVAAWLEVGQSISEEKIKSLLSQDEIESAYQLALNYINYQPRTKSEVTRRLERNSIPEQTIQSAVNKLEKKGLLNDYQFAKDWIENRNTFRPRSRRALAYELNNKGINPNTITALLDEVDEPAMAYRAASKQSKKYRHDNWDSFRKKMFGFLSRRGFSYELSTLTVKKVWDEILAENRPIEEKEKL